MRSWAIAALGLALCAAPAWARQEAGQTRTATALSHQIERYLAAKLAKNKDFADVHASVRQRVVTLEGSVPNYRAKLEAEHQARHVASVEGVINRLAVTAPVVPDATMQRQIDERLTYDRQFMGQIFNALTVKVHHGVVTVGGVVRDYPDRDSALDIVEDTDGVRGVVDNIEVAPLSPMDDQIRFMAARAIYGRPEFERYALNPAHPIRIVVLNGHVTLEGFVNSEVDKTQAGMIVRRIPGVFSVKNELQVVR
jgi:hyperosmotically inducible periplasmic protein